MNQSINPSIINQYFYYRKVWKLRPATCWILACSGRKLEMYNKGI